MALNELPPPNARVKLCPTDSRFRPDIRFMEEGLIDRASEEKNRLEEKQREARKERKSRKEKEIKAKYETSFEYQRASQLPRTYVIIPLSPLYIPFLSDGSNWESTRLPSKKTGCTVEDFGRRKSISQ